MTNEVLEQKFVEAFEKYTRSVPFPLVHGERMLKHAITLRIHSKYTNSMSFITVSIYTDGEGMDFIAGYRIRIGEFKNEENDIKLSYSQLLELSDESPEHEFDNWSPIGNIIDDYDSKLANIFDHLSCLLERARYDKTFDKKYMHILMRDFVSSNGKYIHGGSVFIDVIEK